MTISERVPRAALKSTESSAVIRTSTELSMAIRETGVDSVGDKATPQKEKDAAEATSQVGSAGTNREVSVPGCEDDKDLAATVRTCRPDTCDTSESEAPLTLPALKRDTAEARR